MSVKMLQPALVYGGQTGVELLSHEKKVVAQLVGNEKAVLEVGAYTGFFSWHLAQRGCRVTAVELDPRAAAKARGRVERMIVGDIEEPSVSAQVAGPFDVILFMHVLEHMIDPWKVLRQARHWLGPGGSIIVLLPNIACWRARKELFFRGVFQYTETGIMDRTHLRFFTFNTAQELLESSGYRVAHWETTQACVPLERRLSLIPGLGWLSRAWHHRMSRRFPNLCSEIFLFRALPSHSLQIR